MDEAFLELIEKKDFTYITVKEICAKAGVNRSTFYLHYETISDLLAESVEYMHQKFLDSFSDTNFTADNLSDCPKEELYLITPQHLTKWVEVPDL